MTRKTHTSIRTDALATEICERLSCGEPLRRICRDAGVSWAAVYAWIKADADLAARVARARDLGFQALAEEALEIADTPVFGTVKTHKPDGAVEVREEEMLGHRKLQIETRLKLLACWDPKRYGNKVVHGGDPEAPLTVNFSDIVRKI